MFALAQDSSRSRISRGAISSELTTWGKKPVFRGANCSSVALEVRRSSPLQTVNPLEQPPRKICPGEELLRSSRSTLKQIPPREILLL
jgi:hypothetical protein